MTAYDTIAHLKPCPNPARWLRTQPDLKTAWESCEYADWMLSLAGRLSVPHSLIVLAACDCARTALPYVKSGEDQPRLAIEADERWAVDPTEENREVVGKAARAVSAAAYGTAYAAYAAYAATRAAYAWNAAFAAAYAACAASYATCAAGGPRKVAPTVMADLVRARIPWSVVAERLETIS